MLLPTNNPRTKKILSHSNFKIEEITKYSDKYFATSQKNCENMIGTVSLPLGITGPLVIKGDYANGDFVIPLATTEGALIASINRGCKAITQSGGAIVSVENIGITRSPVFKVKTTEKAKILEKWINNNFELLKKETKKTSNYLELMEIDVKIVEKYVYLKCYFDSKDAMGMNMATFACEHISEVIINSNIETKLVALSSNYCSDKKPSKSHINPGRGICAKAKITLSKDVIEGICKTNISDLIEVYEAKIISGSKLAGMLGQNSHIANIIAAIFIATGQDPVHIVEASSGTTILKKINETTLKFSVTIPSLVCGVIGGGTHLPKQKEALRIMNIVVDEDNPGKAKMKFAEIIIASVLAGEISLLAAIASGTLGTAHRNLGRKK